MSSIRILSENLANQIAAGEVVERPASVVKELLENSADSGAGAVTVQVGGSGTDLRVIDNGAGMDADDLLLCLERHATSKLADEGDLLRVRTMGFRGEALPSIASVSRMTMVSRPAGAVLGNRVEVRFGRVVRVGEAGSALGTTVEVNDLFGNVPARKKFLRSRRTELAHVETAVRNFSLAWPQIAVIYQNDGRERLRLAPASPIDRFRHLFKPGHITPFDLDEDIDSGGVRVSGGLMPPEECDASARLVLLVNQRPVRDRVFFHAVAEGTRGFIPAGGRPGGIVMLDLPPAEVDVNVHPAKLEVRFKAPARIMSLVTRAVAAGIAAMQESIRPVLGAAVAVTQSPPEDDIAAAAAVSAVFSIDNDHIASPSTDCDKMFRRRYSLPTTTTPEFAESGDAGADPAPGDGFAIIGQMFDTYIIGESGDELLIIDQHAAQERMRFEVLKAQYTGGAVVAQKLMFPERVELSASEVETVEDNYDQLARFGLELEPFGGATFIVKAVPALLSGETAATVVRDVLARMPGVDGGTELVDSILASMACRSSIMAGRRLAVAEMADLVEDMRRSGVFSHCPHGRPVLRRFTRSEIKGWFKRT